ncbi:MAG: CBS domain-containing protein [Alicyclobacillus sp.]|nr:CBS domain-containing protein [Alicyclobacillus sp.]
MFIRNALTAADKLTIVRASDTVGKVLDAMGTHLSLPCLDENGYFLGMVSKRTVFDAFVERAASGSDFASFLEESVTPCVDTAVPTLTLDSPFEATLDIIIRYPFAPIVQDGKLVGIVKRGDVNRALSVAFATNMKTQRLLIGMAEIEGALQRLFTITHRLGVNVVSAVTFDARVDALNRRLLLKVTPTPHFQELCSQLEQAGYSLLSVEG